jgi:hypothetical protein
MRQAVAALVTGRALASRQETARPYARQAAVAGRRASLWWAWLVSALKTSQTIG